MKKAILSIFMLLGVIQVIAQITNPAPYCPSQVNWGYNMISSVNVQGSNFLTGAEGTLSSDPGYAYYNTTTFPALTSGASATIAIGFYVPEDVEPMYYAVWIDYNHNNAFESTELVMQNSNTSMAALPVFNSTPVTLTKTFTVPAGLTPGSTRMRVRRGQKETGNIYSYDNSFSLNPCPVYDPNSGNTYGYTYDFNVTIGGGGGQVMAPDAAFTTSTTTATVNNTTVTFTDQSTNTPTSWVWTFTPNTVLYQNGTSATTQNPQVKFTATGTYTVKLKASNAGGADSISQINYINVQNPAPQPPHADFIANSTTTLTNTAIVIFTDQSTNAPTVRSWSFSPNTIAFQNGGSATSTNPQVTFNNAGVYSVKLLVSNAYGSDSTTKINYISVLNPQGPPHADFTANFTNAVANNTVVSFSDLSTGTPTSWHWTFSPNSLVYQNNTNSISSNPKIIFTVPGDYTVRLKVTNAEGADSIAKTAFIHVVSDGSTSISNANTNTALLNVYPNPVSEYLNFDVQKNTKIIKASIIALNGKMIQSYKRLDQNSIYVGSLPKGLYFLKIEFGNGGNTEFMRFSKL